MKKLSSQWLIAIVAVVVCLNSCRIAEQRILKKENSLPDKKEGMRQALQQEKEKTADPHLGIIPVERLTPAYEYAKGVRKINSKKTRAAVSNIIWTERGPNNVGGRTRSIIFDKNDTTSKTVWAGSVGGGLWKTNDITAISPVWTKTNDFFNNIAITTIAQDPTNYNVIYFGTGEGFGNSDGIRGLGIWKTLDGGLTWNQLPSTNNSSFYFVQKMIIRANGDVFACTHDGVYKSINNGSSWTKVLGGGISGSTQDASWDIELGQDEDLYVGMNGEVFKSDHAIHQSNTGNIGTWANVSPTGTYERVEMVTAPSDSNIVFAICNGYDSVLQIMRSPDGGSTWASVTKPGFCDQGFSASDYTRGQAWYDLIGAIDPNDPNTIYIGGVDALKSSDGGTTWTQISSWSGGGAFNCVAPNIFVHADHHAIVFNGNHSNEILWGTDGGVYRTIDSGANFESKISSYNVTQYYACANHPLQTDYFLAGAQDNGTQRFVSPGMNSTTDATGGDGMFCHIDQTDGRIQITSYYNNFYNISTNNGNTFSFMGGDGSGRFVNPTDLDHVNKIFYGAYKPGFYELVTDLGNTNSFDTRDISLVVDSTRTATAVKVDPNNPTTVWMGFRSFLLPAILVKIENASSAIPTVTNMSNGLPVNTPIYLSNIDIEKGNSNHILVSYSNYGIPSVFETVDGGLNWNSVEGNLPDMPVRWVILHPDSNDMAFAATELGVWSTTNLDGANTSWTQTNDNLANTRIDMLKFRESDHVLSAATHGRGLFTTTIPHTPKLNFDAITKQDTETPTTTIDCRKFTDYTINAMTSLLDNLPIKANIIVKPGATASEKLDFEYTTNGSFTANAIQVEFSGTTVSIPVTIRVYDDREFEPTAEMFTLTFDSISSNALAGIHNEFTFTINDNSDDPLLARRSIWTEDFESGMNPPTNWVLTGIDVNQFGNQNFACGSTINNFTMQVYNTVTNACGYDNAAGSDASVHKLVDATGYANLQASFDWVGEGEGGYDWGELVYSTDTTTPNWIIVPGTPQLNGATTPLNVSFNLPASLDGTTFLLGWHWLNDFSVGGSAFGIDNIVISGMNNRLIETTVSNNNEYLGPNGETYYYNNDGDIICRILNLENHDYGCTYVEIDRAGTGTEFLIGETDTMKKIFDKTFRIKPTNNKSTGHYLMTVYVTNDEIAGFETQGRTWLKDGKLFKTTDSVSLATIYSPRDTAIAPIQSIFLNGAALSGEFKTGFSGFGIGNPGKQKYPVGIQSISKNGILIYPNPVTDYCHIRTIEPTEFKLVNHVGQVLDRFMVNGEKDINFNHLSAGMYFLIATESNSSFKLIKQ